MSARSDERPLILLVEDSETVRHAFTILLEDAGYRVVEACSGSDALDRARREGPDLVLMDLGLPDMNGLEVTRRLKAAEETRHVTVVALTGHALESDKRACLDAGCAGYLPKPIDSARLLRSIPEFLGKR